MVDCLEMSCRAPGALCVADGTVDQLLDQLSQRLAVSPDVAADIVLQVNRGTCSGCAVR